MEFTDFDCFYEILEVKETSTQQEILDAFYRLTTKWNQRGTEEAKEKIQLLLRACNCLIVEENRIKYDKLLQRRNNFSSFEVNQNIESKIDQQFSIRKRQHKKAKLIVDEKEKRDMMIEQQTGEEQDTMIEQQT